MSKKIIEDARRAVTELRDAAREGRIIEFWQRDPLVMAIHKAIDIAEGKPSPIATKE